MFVTALAMRRGKENTLIRFGGESKKRQTGIAQSLCNVSLPNEPVDPRTGKTTYSPGAFFLTLWENWRTLRKIWELIPSRDPYTIP